jgi:hypothetical protein|mmetsp:Transcript_14029/g.25364  ORF Transcript_14029/g.25364 Transcript_14029/m.25364 type:complete len:313 (-) Transcript_14029:141-1079(-)
MTMMVKIILAVSFLWTVEYAASFTPVTSRRVSSTFALFATQKEKDVSAVDRRTLLSTAAASIFVAPSVASAAAAAVQDSLNVGDFLRTGVDIGGNMGVSSQAGKSRPQTGVVLRDGSDVLQDSRSGDVLAEILTGTKAKPVAVIASFASPWPLQTGSVFDVECRDGKSGNGAFLAVSDSVGGKSLAELPSSFFLGRLFDPTGRFSFYGPPTDVKVKKSTMIGTNKRLLEITFSILSQSTNSEIGRHALLVATIPEGTDNAVMLTASGLERRWKKDVEEAAKKTIDSFRALPAPKTNMKLRAKDRGGQFDSFE